MKVLLMLIRREWRCDFGVHLSTHVIYEYFVDFIIFGCRVQASQPVEPAQASSPHFTVRTTEVDMMKLSSSNTEEVLNLLFFSPAHDSCSPVSNLRLGFGSNMFEDWPESNDMAASVYIALTADALSSHVPESEKSKIDATQALAPHSDSTSIADFDKSKWEILYPLFVSEGIIDPSKGVNRKHA
jgi:hypothetical protein